MVKGITKSFSCIIYEKKGGEKEIEVRGVPFKKEREGKKKKE